MQWESKFGSSWHSYAIFLRELSGYAMKVNLLQHARMMGIAINERVDRYHGTVEFEARDENTGQVIARQTAEGTEPNLTNDALETLIQRASRRLIRRGR